MTTMLLANYGSMFSYVDTELGIVVSDGSFTAAIVAEATRRRLTWARRLGLADATVTSVETATFSPTPAPSSPPTTAAPIPAPTAVVGSSSSAAGVSMAVIFGIMGGLVFCVGCLSIIFCMNLKKGTAPRPAQTVPGSGVEMSMPVVALPVTAVSGGPLADQVAKQQAASGQPVIMNLTAPQQAQKSSVAI